MKTVKKLLSILIIIITLYILLVFTNKILIEKIEDFIWLKWFSNNFIFLKEKYDEIFTKLPTKEEVYNEWEQIKKEIDDKKEIIDNIRVGVKDLETKYNQTKDFIEDTNDKIIETKWKIEDLKNWLNNIENIWSWIINNVSSWAINNSNTWLINN